MYPNVWNIKEILNTSDIGSKLSGRGGATSDYSSLTDSQFMFTSQFWPDQIGLSQDSSLQSKNSQQYYQEVNEHKISTNYHTKPYLFGGESTDKSKMPNLTFSKTKGILEKFEEEKKKTKGKTESEMLMSELSQIKESMENIKNSLCSMDGKTDTTTGVVVEGWDRFTKTFQDAVDSIKEGFTLQLGAELGKFTCHLEAKISSEVATLATSVHSQHKELETLRTEKAKQQCVMGEILSLLQTVVSTQPPLATMADRCVQTSPRPWEPLCLGNEETRSLQSLQLSTGLAPLPQGGVLDPSLANKPGLQASALTEALGDGTYKTNGQKPYYTRSATTHPPEIWKGIVDVWAQETEVARSLTSKTLENLSLLTQEDGGIHGIGRVPKQAGRQRRATQRGQKTRVSKVRRKALAPLRGRGNGNRGGALMLVPTSCPSPVNHTSENARVPYNPCAGWSQDSSSTQFVSGCEKTTESWVTPLPEAKTGITQKGFWQLFDFCDDSH